jgi:hypothetical protein
LDVRRVWECPACGRRIKRQGDVVTYQCHCKEPPVWMRLVEPARAARDYQPYIVPEIQADELADQEDAPVTEDAVLVEADVLTEAAPPEELPDLPGEEEFYAPEETAEDIPASFRQGVVAPIEPAIIEAPPSELVPIEPPPADVPPAGQPSPPSSEQQPRPGKSKRRRGRKRNRRGNPGSEGG